MSDSVFPMFSSRSFIVSSLTFRSLIHFELIFVYGVRKCSNFFLLQEVDQFSQHHLLKRFSFLHYIFLPPLSKISVHRCMDLSLSFLFCSTDLYFCLCASLDDCSFVVQSEVRQVDFSSSILLSQDALAIRGFCISIQIVKLFVLIL